MLDIAQGLSVLFGVTVLVPQIAQKLVVPRAMAVTLVGWAGGAAQSQSICLDGADCRHRYVWDRLHRAGQSERQSHTESADYLMADQLSIAAWAAARRAIGTL